MKQQKWLVGLIAITAVILFAGIGPLSGSYAAAALQKGNTSPGFPALKAAQKKPMVLLYFFQLHSKPSIAGFDHLKELYREYEKAGIRILAIARDDGKTLNQYFEKNPVPFQVITDDGTIFSQYEVKVILPVTYILGAGGRISDRFEGGGASSYQMMTTVAQRSLDLKKPQVAKAVYAKVLKSDPENITAKAGIANAYFSEGNLDRAKEEFTRIAQLASPDAILGKEGLVKTYLKEGNKEKALALATQIKEKYPESGLVHLIKGNILAEKGNKDEALSEYSKATDGKMSADWQTAEAYNNSGRIYSEQGEYALAEKMYQNATVHNPFSAEILTNRGVLYEKQGQPQKAKALYEDALSADPEDAIAKSLGKRIEAHLNFQEDMEKQKRIDTLVTDLAAQYQKIKDGKQTPPEAATDPWSSRPLTLAFFGIKTTGWVREGVTDAIQHEITQNLAEDQASPRVAPLLAGESGTTTVSGTATAGGRVQVLDREMMDKLLAELKLGSSELADPETALRLGRLLSARLMVTGNLYMADEGLKLSLRLIDPETSAIKMIYSSEKETTLSDLSSKTALALNQRITALYPLQGKIALVEGDDQVIINLGTRHGMSKGMSLKIIEEGEPIVLNNKILGSKKKQVGTVQVTNVEEGISYARIVEGQGLAKKDQKVVEDNQR